MRIIDFYPYLAYAVMGNLLLRSLAHYWTAYSRIRRLPKVDLPALIEQIRALPAHRPTQWHSVLKRHWQIHPATEVILWATEEPHRLAHLDWHKNRLKDDISRVFGDLEADIRRTIAIASPSGFVFTVLGLMLFVFTSQHNLSIQTLLQALGPALGTTALGGIIMVLGKRLQQGALAQERTEITRIGNRLLEALHDRIAEQRWQQNMKLRKETRYA